MTALSGQRCAPSSSVRRIPSSASIRSWPCPACATRSRDCGAPVVAVSPIIGGQAVKGPTAKMMQELGLAVSSASVATRYGDLFDGYIVDQGDAQGIPVKVHVAPAP